MIYYRPFTWHLLAVLDYLKSHFGTKIIVCTKAGEHYAASVLAALISNFTSANPDLIVCEMWSGFGLYFCALYLVMLCRVL